MTAVQRKESEAPAKPRPSIFPYSKGYWEGTKKGELLVQKCASCSHLQSYPRTLCENCGKRVFEWVKSSGKGKMYSYTVIREVVMNSPAFEKEIPYVLAIIELEEGVRMVAQVMDCPLEKVSIGMPVEISTFEPLDGVSIVKFKPA